MRYKRLELVSQAKGHGFESRLPLLLLMANNLLGLFVVFFVSLYVLAHITLCRSISVMGEMGAQPMAAYGRKWGRAQPMAAYGGNGGVRPN